MTSLTTPATFPDAIPFDFHSHHWRCGHAVGEMRDYIDAAHSLGMSAFGVSDHGPAYWLPGDHAKPGTQMAVSAFPEYFADARALQKEYAGRIDVRVGLEADFIPGHEDDLRRLLDSQDLDYVLGSVHYAHGGASIFNKARWGQDDPEAVYIDYYAQVQQAAASGLFDILSHLTAVEAYGPPIGGLADRLYPPVADAVAESGCLVEINTSGYRKMGGDEPFPNRQMLRLLVERGVPLTFGSDCHMPKEVGYGRDRVRNLLGELGVEVDNTQSVTIRRKPLWAYSTRRQPNSSR